MRRTWFIGVAVAGFLLVGLLWQNLGAQVADNGVKAKTADTLPIKQVILFNSGVGYFQREGEVDGNARVELSFPTSDINDLLKSLVLQDMGGGKISTVSYDSQDPLDKILRSFALDLHTNPTFSQILNQARGEKIEVMVKEKKEAEATKLKGTIIGMEAKRKPAEKESFVDEEFLNLSTSQGMESIPMASIVAVKFLNQVLENEFQRALKVLAGSHDMEKKLVSLGFNGDGKRKVRVGYVTERPIWKTSYRLRLEDQGKMSLQGWAMVENPSDDDWQDVKMVLVSGKPISFQMNLYDPIYIPRPMVEPALFASLRPPVYAPPTVAEGGSPFPPGMGQGVVGGFGGIGGIGGFQGFNGFQGGFNGQFGQFGQFGQIGGIGGQNNNSIPPNAMFQNGSMQGSVPNNKLTYEELQKRRQDLLEAKGKAVVDGKEIAGLNFKEGIQSVATSEEIGDYYQYTLGQKISLSRQKSAMLPIVDENIEGSKVSIYNPTIHAKYPLLGLRLKNTSGKPLTQGPITVYDGSTYAGDTRILDLQPGEERLLSYALDQGTEVVSTTESTPSPDMFLEIGEANLTARYQMRQTRSYAIRNRSKQERSVIIEHAIRGNWDLISPKKPSEKTRDVYRFVVKVPPGKTVTQEVVEEETRIDTKDLTKKNVGEPYYAIAAGVEVKPVTGAFPPKLVGIQIQKGTLLPRYKVRESKSYMVQNLSGEDRSFTVDHIIRPDWVLLDAIKKDIIGPGVYRFKLKVDRGKSEAREVVEERTFGEKEKLVKDVPETQLRQFLNDPATSVAVKEALTRVLDKTAKLRDAKTKAESVEKRLTALSKDQVRVRDNLGIIPRDAKPYQTFLDKFVAQETEIETLQRQSEAAQTTVTSLQQELDAYLENLHVE